MPFSPASSSSNSSSPVKRTAIYTFSWAYEKVDMARRSHARAWEILDPVLNLSERQLAYLLACNAPEWPVIRSIVHQIDKWLAQQARVGPVGSNSLMTTKFMIPSLKILFSKIALPELKAYLTGRIKSLILEEQVKKVEDGLYPSSGLFAEAEPNGNNAPDAGKDEADLTLVLE